VSAAERLAASVERALPRLRAISDAEASAPPAEGKWSPKEVLGHLIDSASNNHGRFVRARWAEDLVFPGYEQEKWVAAQRYADAAWEDLIALWRGFNLHIARVMGNVPEEVAHRPRGTHNLDQIAWRTVPRHQPVTLDYFMNDYVDHLEHHLGQIFGRDTMSA
jgi:uncharacterized damage-inducible protein DinB